MGANLAPALPRFEVTVTLAAVDDSLSYVDRQKVFQLDPSITDYGDAALAVSALLVDLLAASKCDCVGYVINSIFRGNAGSVTAVGNPYKEASLTLNLATAGKAANHTLFAPVNALVSGTNINEGNALLTSYLDNFEQAAGEFCISDGEFVATANQIKSSKLKSAPSGKSFG